MSTWWYYECLSHNPPLQSDGEFTQHTNDAAFHAGVALVGQRPVVLDHDDAYGYRDYFERHARRFLASHPGCRIGLVNEYGHRESPGDAYDKWQPKTATDTGEPTPATEERDPHWLRRMRVDPS